MTAASSSNTIRDSRDGETPRGFGNAEVMPRQVPGSVPHMQSADCLSCTVWLGAAQAGAQSAWGFRWGRSS